MLFLERDSFDLHVSIIFLACVVGSVIYTCWFIIDNFLWFVTTDLYDSHHYIIWSPPVNLKIMLYEFYDWCCCAWFLNVLHSLYAWYWWLMFMRVYATLLSFLWHVLYDLYMLSSLPVMICTVVFYDISYMTCIATSYDTSTNVIFYDDLIVTFLQFVIEHYF